ncbi:hypothetical protein D5086_030609 [Populus alba]|uniref:Uncharacterized protein n=1 Tax=Populus alba TaxID=43335 RepID=A0ACC4ANY3_POPAL
MVALFKIQDHGIVPDGSEEMTKSQPEVYRRALTQELSRHAAVILRGTHICLERDPRTTRSSAEFFLQIKFNYVDVGNLAAAWLQTMDSHE